MCKKVEDDGVWEPADRILYDASHTYCPDCVGEVREEIRALKKAGFPQPRRRSAVHVLRELFDPPFYTQPKTGEP